jgi:biopolymer transport protein ExbB
MRWADLVVTAGWLMAPIGLCSVVATAVFLKKLSDFRALRLRDWAWLSAVLADVEAGAGARAQADLQKTPNPAAGVLAEVLAVLADRPSRVEAEARRAGSQAVQGLEAYLALLAFIAQAAPLLGLLGTVVGMVELFLGLEGAGLRDVDTSLLSAGIWKALLTTAAGLGVAVPTLAGHAYLASRVDTFRLALLDAVERLITAAAPRGEA